MSDISLNPEPASSLPERRLYFYIPYRLPSLPSKAHALLRSHPGRTMDAPAALRNTTNDRALLTIQSPHPMVVTLARLSPLDVRHP